MNRYIHPDKLVEEFCHCVRDDYHELLSWMNYYLPIRESPAQCRFCDCRELPDWMWEIAHVACSLPEKIKHRIGGRAFRRSKVMRTAYRLGGLSALAAILTVESKASRLKRWKPFLEAVSPKPLEQGNQR